MSASRATAVAVAVALTASVGALDVVPPLGWIVVALVAVLVAVLVARSHRGSDALLRVEAERASGWRDFHRELIRSRRRAHPLALVRIPAAASDPVAQLIALERVRGSLRRADAAWVDEADLYVMLPETSRDAAWPALTRLAALGFTAERAPRLAVFPDDGLTSGVLVSAVAGASPTAVAVRGPIAAAVARQSTGATPNLAEPATDSVAQA